MRFLADLLEDIGWTVVLLWSRRGFADPLFPKID